MLNILCTQISAVALKKTSYQVRFHIYLVLSKKTFRANIAQWCMCTTSDHWSTCSSLTFVAVSNYSIHAPG